MSKVEIILPDQSVKTFDHEPSALEVAQTIGSRLAGDTLGVRVNGAKEIQDFRTPLKNGSKIELITTKSPDAIEVIRHSSAHLMAQAVQNLWPDVKVTIGPVIDTGFYYDFDSPRNFTEEDFEKIEKEMAKVVSADYPITREEWPIQKAIDTFTKMGERFKVELIQGLADKGEKTVGIYSQGPWFDLCKGPHVQRTGQLKTYKLLSVAGAYWRGDEKNPMLQRIYATAFASKDDLEKHLHRIEEAKKRDHRKLGKEMGLFQFHPVSPGAPFFTGKGATIYGQLQTLMRELYGEYGYQEVITPQIFDVDLFKTSGHYDNYRENMYFMKVDDRDFSAKPMNCPSHCLMFGAEKHSYRELPVRMADFGRLHRYERAGAMHGLTRVRTFCQDDAHIFCRVDQLQDEISKFMQMLSKVYSLLGMTNYKVYLSTRPEKRVGSDEVWDRAEGALMEALKRLDIPYTVNAGDGAFYGPKLDIMFVDAIERPWQLGTMQVDFNLPNLFDLKYTGEDNAEHKPVILHRAILGSLERFIGVYLEHCAGHLPPWLTPVQAVLLNVTDRVNDFCRKIQKELADEGVRVEFDQRNEKLNYKIREAQLQKIPYMLVVGDREAEADQLSVRLRDGTNLPVMSSAQVKKLILEDIRGRKLNPTKEVSH